MTRAYVQQQGNTIFQFRDYEPQQFSGTITFPLKGKVVTLDGKVTTPGDHQSVTPDTLAALAEAQGVSCVVADWTPPQHEDDTDLQAAGQVERIDPQDETEGQEEASEAPHGA